MRGGARFRLKIEPESAIKDLKACGGTKEDDENLHFMLGQLYEKTGSKRKAIREYKNCIIIAPQSGNVEYYKSRIKALEK
jgi:tetratricopeptide (TPR) repeat protein